MIIFSWFLFVVVILNLLVLSFAFRDFSLLLTLQFLISAIGLPIASYLITKNHLQHFLVLTDDQANLDHDYTEETDEEFNLEGRFLLDD